MTGPGEGLRPAGVVPARWETCGQAWIALMGYVMAAGWPADDDRGPVLEAPAALFQIAGLSRADPVLVRYGQPGKMALYDRKFTQTVVCPPFKYSYGARLRCAAGVDQLAGVAELLAARPYSKSGWLSLILPGERSDAVPCLAAVAFRIRGAVLNMSAIFRSQNAFTAYLNYLPLRDVQSEVARPLRLPCGPMQVYVDVPHVYVNDVPEVRTILRADRAADRREREKPVSSSAD